MKEELLKEHDCPHCSEHIEDEAEKPEGGCCHEHGHGAGCCGCEGEEEGSEKTLITRLILGAALYLGAILFSALFKNHILSLPLYIVAYLILGYDVVLTAIKNIARGRIFDEHFLMSVSTIGAFIIREYPEAVAVMLLYQLGEFLQDRAVDRSRRSISALLDIRPDQANLYENGEITAVSAKSVEVGKIIAVRPGERVPLDGIITEGESLLDMSALTGESVPKRVSPGEMALSGSINESGVIYIKTEKTFGESTASKIIDMVENASARKAPSERFITKFARYYTPVVVLLAVLIAVIPPVFFEGDWTTWIHRAFISLIISCPCALVISIPLTFFGGLGAASKKGILVKGGNYLEALGEVTTVVFDKTGTLTKGVFAVSRVIAEEGFSEKEILRAAAEAERFSTHPIARSILAAYGDADFRSEGNKEESGGGVCAVLDGKEILTGKADFLAKRGVPVNAYDMAAARVYVAIDGKYAGCITIEDEIKSESRQAIEQLRKLGVKRMVMLTGDDKETAKKVAGDLGISECYAGMMPDEKLSKLEEIEKTMAKGEKTAFVGDGINDAPVIARADVGIAMGGLGADAAIEAADVVIMTDDPAKLAQAKILAQETKKIAIQNIIFALGVKAVLLILGAAGIANMWMAVFGDTGVALLAVLNAMRIMKK